MATWKEILEERKKKFKLYKKIGGNHVWQLKGAPDAAPFFFETKMAIDADGAPNAYAPLTCKTCQPLDNLGNACAIPEAPEKGACWGIYKDKKTKKIPVQKAGDPYPGHYVPQTSLVDRRVSDETDPTRYVNATEIPYIGLPLSDLKDDTGLRVGDFAFVINLTNRAAAFAIFADSKKSGTLGEGSIYLAKSLGRSNTSARNGTVPRGIFYLVFPGSGAGQGFIPSPSDILLSGKRVLDCWEVTSPGARAEVVSGFAGQYPNIDVLTVGTA